MAMEENDPVLDSWLEEVLAGRAPPDLTERIMQVWSERCRISQTPAESKSIAPLLSAVSLASREQSNGEAALVSIDTGSKAKRQIKPLRRGRWIVVLTSCAAAILGIAVGAMMLSSSRNAQLAQKQPPANQPSVARSIERPTESSGPTSSPDRETSSQ